MTPTSDPYMEGIMARTPTTPDGKATPADRAATDLNALKARCSRYLYGQCTTRGCLIRGGYSGTGPADAGLAMCEERQIVLEIEALQARVVGLAGAANALLEERSVNTLEEAAREYPHGKEDVAEVLGVFDNLRAILAATPTQAMERARAVAEVVKAARLVAEARAIEVESTPLRQKALRSALAKLDALDEGG